MGLRKQMDPIKFGIKINFNFNIIADAAGGGGAASRPRFIVLRVNSVSSQCVANKTPKLRRFVTYSFSYFRA